MRQKRKGKGDGRFAYDAHWDAELVRSHPMPQPFLDETVKVVLTVQAMCGWVF